MGTLESHLATNCAHWTACGDVTLVTIELSICLQQDILVVAQAVK